MSVLAGPFAIAAVVLALGGAFKALEPADTAHALGVVGLPASRTLVRVGGALEAILAVGALVTGNPVLAALVAVSYAALRRRRRRRAAVGQPISSCGCFGKVDTPPSALHVVLNLAAAGVAAGAVFVGASEINLPDVLADQPLLGIPFVLLVAIGVGLVFLALTALPKTLAAARSVRP